jgi:putative oxidoreductase
MNKWMSFLRNSTQPQLTNVAMLLMRISIGLGMVYGHGFKKLMKILGDDPIRFADPIGLGQELSIYMTTFAEFICASLVVIGLFTRLSCIPVILVMLVAWFFIQWPNPFADQELTIVYLTSFVVIFLVGPGKYSLDYKLNRNK